MSKPSTARSGAGIHRAWTKITAATALALAGGLLVSACSGQPAAPAATAKAAAAGSPAALPAGATLLATLRKPVARYPHPAATAAGLVCRPPDTAPAPLCPW